MKKSELHSHELCSDESPKIISKILDFLEQDGFDISNFTLVSTSNYIYEFIHNIDQRRGFTIFYDPQVLLTPVPQYQLHTGSIFFTFNARSITEAYLLHNKEISENDYQLLSKSYTNTENSIKHNAKVFAEKYGIKAACDGFNCTAEWLNS